MEWSVRALLLAVGTGVVVGALRVRAAAALHRAWTAAMVAMLLLPAWTTCVPTVSAPVLPAVREPVRMEPAPGVFAEQVEVSTQAVAGAVRPARGPLRPDWRQIALGVYLAGIAVMLVRLMRGTRQVRSMVRGASAGDGFVTSPLCAAPVTIGWLRPVLLLPESWRTWSTAKLEAVLIHEREHVRRRDSLVQWLALLNRCLFWFHPLAWWLERKLAALAEEACDAVVLARGHAPHEYAQYLIEIARSVNQTGARIRWAGAVAFSNGKLPQRIRLIMDARTVLPVSRAKSMAAAGLCGVLIVMFGACSLGRHAAPAAGQAAMSQQEQTDRARFQQQRQRQQQADVRVWTAALALTPAGANELTAYVQAHPNDQEKLLELVRYRQSKKDWKALDELTLWFIAQHPEARVDWGLRPAWDTVWDRDGYERGRQLWTGQMKKPWSSPFVYMNAAEFLSGNDNEQAEQILLEGRRRFPSSPLHWEVFLARHYAWALAGRAEQLPEDRMVVTRDAPPAQGPYARKVRETLPASTDVDLLTRTVEELQVNRASGEFARSLVDRVLAIEPENKMAHTYRDGSRRADIVSRAAADPSSVSEADRMVLLEAQLRRPGAPDTEATAKELLTLAARNAKDADCGTAIFLGHLALGAAVLERGDKAEAVRHLLATADAPPTEFLRYEQIDMSLARKLVDAGERDAVATFLDRCAKFNRGGKPLAQWAAQIRRGFNPGLAPNSRMFRPAQ